MHILNRLALKDAGLKEMIGTHVQTVHNPSLPKYCNGTSNQHSTASTTAPLRSSQETALHSHMGQLIMARPTPVRKTKSSLQVASQVVAKVSIDCVRANHQICRFLCKQSDGFTLPLTQPMAWPRLSDPLVLQSSASACTSHCPPPTFQSPRSLSQRWLLAKILC